MLFRLPRNFWNDTLNSSLSGAGSDTDFQGKFELEESSFRELKLDSLGEFLANFGFSLGLRSSVAAASPTLINPSFYFNRNTSP